MTDWLIAHSFTGIQHPLVVKYSLVGAALLWPPGPVAPAIFMVVKREVNA